MGRWGTPREIVTDQGNNLTKSVMPAIYHVLNIRKKASTPHHPNTDGLTERYNQTLVLTLKKVLADNPLDWDEWCEFAAATYRFSVQKAIGDSPFFIMTGQDPTLPLDLLRQPDMVYISKDDNWRANFFTKLEEIRQQTIENLRTAQRRMKNYFDKNLKDKPEIRIGDLVKMYVTKLARTGKGTKGKFALANTGPYRVIAFHPTAPDVVVIEGEGIRQTVNTDKLTRFKVMGPVHIRRPEEIPAPDAVTDYNSDPDQ